MSAYIDHAAYYVGDIPWYADFFDRVFGMKVTRRRTGADGMEEMWLSGGLQLCQIPGESTLDGRAAHLCLLVEDVDACREKALALGCSPMPKHHWVKLPDGLAIEMFPAAEGVLDALGSMKKKK